MIAEAMGTPLMPWQQLVADVALEIDPETGNLAYRTILITVPRQQGKTQLMLALEIDRCLSTPHTHVMYTAQSRLAARGKLIDDQWPVIDQRLRQHVAGLTRGNGTERITWRNGSFIAISASSESSGHGAVLDLAVIDEAFEDKDDRREQALMPAMMTRPDGQLLIVSTQGHEGSLYLNRKCELGRRSIAEDSGSGLAYFEWSADVDADHSDPETWQSCMPALGLTVPQAAVQAAHDSMEETEFRRAYLNICATSSADAPIPMVIWAQLQSDSVGPADPVTLGVETAMDRSWSAIVAADADRVVEVVDYRPGTSWVPQRVADIVAVNGAEVVIDPRGPSRSHLLALELLEVPVTEVTGPQMAAATLELVDDVVDRRLQVRQHPALDAAVEAGRRRWSGEQWFWSRRDALSDISPLVAATLALHGARKPETDSTPWVVVR